MSFLKKIKPLHWQANNYLLRSFSLGLSNKSTNTAATTASRQVVLEPLADRTLIRIQGKEVVPFLQGLITNDVEHVQTGCEQPNCMYAMFLNKGGRVVYDTIIYGSREESTYLLECDAVIASELKKHLMLYRVRRKISVDIVGDEFLPWVAFNANANEDYAIEKIENSHKQEIMLNSDPRTKQLGYRLIVDAQKDWTAVAKLVADLLNDSKTTAATTNCCYRQHRYACGIAEGVGDLPPGKPLPLEANCDFLHGVSFLKGCYIGQELTARVHHTGVVRKRLMPLRLEGAITSADAAVTTSENAKVGVVKGHSGQHAVALLRVEQALAAANGELLVENQKCFVHKPIWWPTELPNRVALREKN